MAAALQLRQAGRTGLAFLAVGAASGLGGFLFGAFLAGTPDPERELLQPEAAIAAPGRAPVASGGIGAQEQDPPRLAGPQEKERSRQLPEREPLARATDGPMEAGPPKPPDAAVIDLGDPRLDPDRQDPADWQASRDVIDLGPPLEP